MHAVSPILHSRAAMSRRGFSLIELAMVLAIFGFIVVGVMAGASLVRDAELRNVAKELAQLRRAVQIYQERYSSFPGDTPDAQGLLKCSGCNGNGNGRIDLLSEDATQAVLEQRLFWEHLSRAGLIKYTLRAADRTVGRLYPPSAAAKGAAITVEGRKPDRVVAMIRFIEINSSGSATEVAGGAGPLTPEEAERVDRMVDDGSPSNGQFVVEAASGAAAADCKDGATNGYASGTNPRCNSAFLMAGRNFQNAQSATVECQWVVTPIGGGTPGGEWLINDVAYITAGTPPGGIEQGWGVCSQSCGPGTQSRKVSCGNPSASGVLNLSVACSNITGGPACGAGACRDPEPAHSRPFTGCITDPPPAQRACNGGACTNPWNPGTWSDCTAGNGTIITVGDWEVSDWGECDKECGTGAQHRTATCRSRVGIRTRTPTCASPPCDGTKPSEAESCTVSNCGSPPAQNQSCNTQTCGGWKTGPWGACSPPPTWSPSPWSACSNGCGGGYQTRSVNCDAAGSVQSRSVTCPAGITCDPATKPAETQTCPTSCVGQRPPESQSCNGGANWGDVYNSTSRIYRTNVSGSDWVGCLTE